VGFPNETSTGAITAIDGTTQGGKKKRFIGIGMNEAGHRTMSLFAERIGQFTGHRRTVIQYFNATAKRMIRSEFI
jgi:hypothetical protein